MQWVEPLIVTTESAGGRMEEAEDVGPTIWPPSYKLVYKLISKLVYKLVHKAPHLGVIGIINHSSWSSKPT